jgi:hypothetical protein
MKDIDEEFEDLNADIEKHIKKYHIKTEDFMGDDNADI